MPGTSIHHNEAAHQFEAGAEPYLAKLQYRLKGQTINIVHTEVPDQFKGQGVAGDLATAALGWARASGLKVIPTCPYVKNYIGKHPEFTDLL